MILGRVLGPAVATVKDRRLAGERWLHVRPVRGSGDGAGEAPTGRPGLVALDRVDAGQGDLVLVSVEGGAARILMGDDTVPLQACVIAVVDDLDSADA